MKKYKNDGLMELLLPENIGPEANLQLASPDLYTFWKFSQDRKLFITQDIDDSIMLYTQMILMWEAEDEKANIPVEERKPITIYILSYGGQIDQIMALIDTIKLCKTIVKTVNLGVCASAGCLLLMSGTKGYRYTMKHSWGLVHQGQGGSQGTAEQVVAQTKNYQKILEQMKEHILECTNITAQRYSRSKNREWYVYPSDMIELGIVDHICDNISDIV